MVWNGLVSALWIALRISYNREFPVGAGLRTQRFHCWGLGLIAGQGVRILQAMWCGQKKKKKRINDELWQLWAISPSGENHPKLPGLTWLKLEMPQVIPVRCSRLCWLQTPVAHDTLSPGSVSIFTEGGRAVSMVGTRVQKLQTG